MINKKLTPFKLCVLQNFPYIEEDFDALTNYQLLCKVVEFLNKTIDAQNEVITEFGQLKNAFIELKDFVDGYLETALQTDVNKKLDEFAEDGTLENIISKYISEDLKHIYNSLELLKIADVEENQKVQTLGYYSINDGGSANYIIRNTTPSGYYETLDNGKFAELIIENDTITPLQFGCKGDGVTDDTIKLQQCLNYAINNYLNVDITGKYLVSPQNDNICLKINGKSNDHLYNNNITINFNGNSLIKTISQNECTLIRFNAGKVVINNMQLQGIRGKTVLFDMARIEDLSTTESSKLSYNLINHFYLQGGKLALNLEGACYYNNFNDGYIQNCDKAIEIGFTKAEKAGLKQDSACNRNNFNNLTITGCSNGIYITYGDTNKFVNVNFEGVGKCIYLDNPATHKVDFPIQPLYFTNDNMFVNITFEAITTAFDNNATGTKVINTSTSFKKEQWKVLPQLYSGGTDDGYSLEKYGRIYKNLVTSKIYTSAINYSDLDDSPAGFTAKTLFDHKLENNDAVNMNLQNFTFDYKDNSNIDIDNITYDRAKVKSIGGVIFMNAKFKFKPLTNTSNIRLYYPESKSWIKNTFGAFSSVSPMIKPISVLVNGAYKLTYAYIRTDSIEIVVPDGNWNSGKYNDVFINIHMFREDNIN